MFSPMTIFSTPYRREMSAALSARSVPVTLRAPVRARRSVRRGAVVRAAAEEEAEDKPPPGCTRYTINILRPLGLVLEEKKEGGIYVGEIVEDGNAAKTGLVNVGDELIATSGVVFNSTTDYGGVSVPRGEETVRMPVRTERFDTVMAAIASNPSQRTVALEFQKCM